MTPLTLNSPDGVLVLGSSSPPSQGGEKGVGLALLVPTIEWFVTTLAGVAALILVATSRSA